MSITTKELNLFFNETLGVNNFMDYGPNGLQVEGKSSISTICFSVSATKESIEKSIQLGADALVVHHGLFWTFHGPKTITGAFAKRIIPLVKNDINLFGFHLPLDSHLQIGNAASLAKLFNLKNIEHFGEYKNSPLGVKGRFEKSKDVDIFLDELKKIFNREIWVSCPEDVKNISSLGIITGGANSGWKDAQKENLDAYLTGEMSEYDWHDAKEAGIVMFAGGHHATEKPGIISLMNYTQKKFKDLDYHFIDSENPA